MKGGKVFKNTVNSSGLMQWNVPGCSWLLFASQSTGGGIILWKGISIYRQLLLGERDGNHRIPCINRMEFDEQGFIKPVIITCEGVARGGS